MPFIERYSSQRLFPLKQSRSIARLLSVAFALPLLPTAAIAQIGGPGQVCYVIADNNPNGDPRGGIQAPDSLAVIDFDAGTVRAIDTIRDVNGNTINNIEAATSRPNFNELIAANGNEIGRVDPTTGIYTPLGTLTPYTDFDAVVIDRQSPNQTRLLGVSKDRGNPALNNVVVEAILEIDGSGLTTGISSITPLSQIPNSEFPANADSIDGIALTDDGRLYGVANRGPAAPDIPSPQELVIIDENNGTLTDFGTFLDENNEPINDVEDISFDLFGDLFASSGSNLTPSANTGYVISLGGEPPVRARRSLFLGSAGSDFEASGCLPSLPQEDGSLLVVKRITAVIQNGEETRFDEFVDQAGESTDNELFDLTNGTFPLGLVQTPDALLPGDEVEYTVYVYNPSDVAVENSILCDPIQPPSVLQSSSVSFSEPDGNNALSFLERPNFARAPLAPADDACEAVLTGDQFPSGPPGPTGGLDVGAGGGVVTSEFRIEPDQIAATRFRVTVGQGNFE